MKNTMKSLGSILLICVLLGGGVKYAVSLHAEVVESIYITFDDETTDSKYETASTGTGGAGELGLKEENGNTFLRILSEHNNLSNKFYTTDTGWGYNSITAEFDIRFKKETGNASADGCSLVLVNPTYFTNIPEMVPTDSPSYTQTLGFGMDVYNNTDPNRGTEDNPTPDMTIWWNKQLKTTSSASDVGGYDYRTGTFLKAKMVVDYNMANRSADVTWTFLEANGTTLKTLSTTVDNILPYLNNPMFGGRTGGAATEVDIDNFKITYDNTLAANDYVWKTGTTGKFEDGANWVNGTAPTGSVNAYFLGDGNVVEGSAFPTINGMNISFSGTTSITQNPGSHLQITSGTLNFLSGTTTITTTNSESVSERALVIGTGTNNTATVNITGGTLKSTGNMFIGYLSGTGILNMSSGTLDVAGKLSVTYGSGTTRGTMNISGGTVDLPAGNIAVVGDGQVGRINLTGTGKVTSNKSLYLGYQRAGEGIITIDSVNASFTNNNVVTVGLMGTGTINLKAGTFTSNNQVRLGSADSSGKYGKGFINVSGGTFKAASVYVGYAAMGEGTIDVSGGAFEVSNSSTTTAPIAVILGCAENSVGTIDFSGGTFVAKSGYTNTGEDPTSIAPIAIVVGNAKDSKGTINVSGGTFTATSTISGKTSATPIATLLGNAEGSEGTINVSGGTFTSYTTYVGKATGSSGTINVTSGTVTLGNVMAGLQSGAVGNIHVSGDGVLNTSSFRLGFNAINIDESNPANNGSGVLTVEGNAVLKATGDLMVGHAQSNDVSYATFAGDSVTTAGGHLIFGRKAKSVITQKDNAVVRFLGSGKDRVFGLVESLGGSGTIYNMSGGLLTDEGEDGSLRLYGFGGNCHMIVGNNGSVTLNQTGGTIQVQNMNIGHKDTIYNLSGGTLNVWGNEAGDNHTLGMIRKNSSADFNFTGGTISAERIEFALLQEGTGNLSPGSRGTLDGTINNIGTTRILGNYTLDGGSITLDLLPDAYDTIVVTGNVVFNDMIDLILNYDSENIQAYSDMPFLTATGTISNWSNLVLDSATDYAWNLYQSGNSLYLGVDRAAVPEPSTWVLLLGLMVGMAFWRKRK